MAFKIKDGLTIGTKIVTDSSGVLDNPIATTGFTTGSTSFNLLNTNAATVTAFGAATALTLGVNGGTVSVLNPTVTLTNATTLNVNGVNPTLATSSIGTVTLFNTNIATVNAFATATTLNIGGTTATHTVNLSVGAHSSGTKTINVGTGGTSGGTTAVVLGTAAGGTSTVTANGSFAFKSGAATITFNTGATGSQTYTWPLTVPAANTVLTSDISGNLSWQPTGSASTATSLGGGTTGSLPYQTSANNTAFLAIGTANQVLTVNSGATAPQWTTSTGTGNFVRGISPTVTTSLVTDSTSFNLLNTTATTVNAFGAATTISIGAATGTTTINNAEVVITGNLTVNGSTTTINSTILTVDDKVIELGAVDTPTNTTANGGGISLLAGTDVNKTILWDSANSNWTSSEHWNIASGKTFKINNVQVLSATALGTSVVGSSLTSVGNLTSLTVAGAVTFGTGAVQINNVELQLAPATTARIFKRAVQPATITANTAQTLDSWTAATYRSAKYLIQVVQGTKYELHEYRFVHDGTTVYATQYAVLETDSANPIALTLAASIAGGTLTVTATVTNASTTNVTITAERTLFAV
jgi:hypothetical protein